MTLDTAISRFRRRQADLFTDALTVTRKTSSGYAWTSGGLTPAATTTTYSGAGTVRGVTATDRDVVGRELEVGTYLVKLPVDTDIAPGDAVTVTASTYDATLVDLHLNVTELLKDARQICRRVHATSVVEVPH